MKYLILMTLLSLSLATFADTWREGKVGDLGSSYNGTSVTFRLYELTADSAPIDYSQCNCDGSWNTLCLNPSRANFDKEFAMLLAAKTAGTNVRVIFNNNQCFISAMILPHGR